MTREDVELIDAAALVGYAEFLDAPALLEDRTAVMQAILCRALELATPDLSPVNRAALFFQPTDH